MRYLLAIAALGAGQPCFSQTAETQPATVAGRPLDRSEAGWSVTIGLAPVLSPAWQGSRDMALSIFPDLRVNYGDVIFASIPEGLGWNAVNTNGWKAGPLAKVRFGRDEERGGSPFLITGGSDGLRGMGNVAAAAELGGFVEKRIGPWRGRLEIRRGFGGHEAVIADGAISYQMRSGRTIINVGPRATVVSKPYMDSYFGIDAIQSQRSGLDVYSPKGGLLSYGVGGSALRPLNRQSAITLFTSLDRLGSEAGHSPLVRERGRRVQFTLGIGYGFRFNL